MRNGPLFFLGLFVALTLSWAGTVLFSQHQLGALAPYVDDPAYPSYPVPQPGIAARGQLVYADLGCAACHTQAVRRPDFGADQARGWGDRQSVARDYIYQTRVQLGTERLGPDLTNLAGRKPSAVDTADLMNLLYTGQGAMPAYKFLFDDRTIAGEPADSRLMLVGRLAPAAGHEIVPTERGQSLVAFLLSLNNTYDYPESHPVPHVTAKKEGSAPAPTVAPGAKKEGSPAPAVAPDAKKEGSAPAPAAAPGAKKEGSPAPAVAPDAKKEGEKK